MLEHLGYARISPHGCNGLADPHVEGLFRVGVDCVFEQVVAVFAVAGALGADVELSHGADEGFGAVDDVFVDGETVHGELVLGVAILVDNLHLLDNGRLAALAGALRMLAFTDGWQEEEAVGVSAYLARGSCIRGADGASPPRACGRWPGCASSARHRRRCCSCSYPWWLAFGAARGRRRWEGSGGTMAGR